jgi:hypothetical protein
MSSGRQLVFGRRFVTGPADSLGRLKLGPPNSVQFRRLNERLCSGVPKTDSPEGVQSLPCPRCILKGSSASSDESRKMHERLKNRRLPTSRLLNEAALVGSLSVPQLVHNRERHSIQRLAG